MSFKQQSILKKIKVTSVDNQLFLRKKINQNFRMHTEPKPRQQNQFRHRYNINSINTVSNSGNLFEDNRKKQQKIKKIKQEVYQRLYKEDQQVKTDKKNKKGQINTDRLYRFEEESQLQDQQVGDEQNNIQITILPQINSKKPRRNKIKRKKMTTDWKQIQQKLTNQMSSNFLEKISSITKKYYKM